MARIRSIKPEFWRSPSTAKASPLARLLYIAMWGWADDYGAAEWTYRELLGYAFPHDEQIGNAELQSILTEVAACFDTVFYRVDGRRYYYIPQWDKHQKNERRAQGKFPLPDAPAASVDAEFSPKAEMRGSSVQTSGSTVPGTGEQGTGEQGKKEQGKSANEVRDDVEALCVSLAVRIENNGSKRPRITNAWRDEARRMLDTDGREMDAALRLIEWCQQDSFWRSNILSMPKFREKYDQLRLAANRQIEERHQSMQPRPTAAQRNLATVAHFEQQAMEIEQ